MGQSGLEKILGVTSLYMVGGALGMDGVTQEWDLERT